MTLSLPIEPQANELLSRDGFALLLAMMLDQQVPFEKAFNSPYQLALRLGHEPTAQELADFDPDALAAVFAERPALHRFPRAMAARAQELARIVADRYDGDASALVCPRAGALIRGPLNAAFERDRLINEQGGWTDQDGARTWPEANGISLIGLSILECRFHKEAKVRTTGNFPERARPKSINRCDRA